MATYCIGDIHGRYDLFEMMLKKINFEPSKDHIYLLGDIIDEGSGSIEMIEYVMCHQDSITLIQGNHEKSLVHCENMYNIIISNPKLNTIMKKIASSYMANFKEIETLFFEKMITKNSQQMLSSPKIKNWLKSGDTKKRTKLIEDMIEFVETIEYDKERYNQIRLIFSFLGEKRTKKLATQVICLSVEEFQKIIIYLKTTTNKIELEVNNRKFCLIHSIHDTVPEVSNRICLPHPISKDINYVFGHVPTPKIHRECLGWDVNGAYLPYNNGFNYNFRKILAYVDIDNNRYYNLDTNSNPLSALKLEDLSQYYVAIPPKNASWSVPEDVCELYTGYIEVNEATFQINKNNRVEFFNGTRKGKVILSIKDNCYEYLIGIYKTKKQILYTRIDWFDYHYAFVIDDWYDVKKEEEIIAKVHNDFIERMKPPDMQDCNRILHGN